MVHFFKFCCIFLVATLKMVHLKCRGLNYPFGNITRLIIKDVEVPWDFKLENYNPEEYNSPSLQNKPWADPDIENPEFMPQFNELDGNINRKSFMGSYKVVEKRPLNPEGRTGLRGRGVLGRWGPNHAADPIVTRWKVQNGTKIMGSNTNLPILQFCAIQRKDCGAWAIPGGMVDLGEHVSETLKREFLEEAFNSLEDPNESNKEMVTNFFKNCGTEIYKGYVDDPRNTDNAWMETIAINFHDEKGDLVGKFNLKAGDDAKNVKWIDISKDLNLYASHSKFIELVAKLRNASW